MASISEQITTILNNSKQVNQLPLLNGINSGDLLAVYNFANNRLEQYPATNFTNQSFSFSINAISQNIGVSVSVNKLDLEYSGSAVTEILFDSVFTQYLHGFSMLSSDYTFVLQLFNSTKLRTHIAEITSIVYSDDTNTYSIAEIANTINPTSLSVNDVIQVQISISKKQLSSKITIEGSLFEYVPILGNDGSSFQAGDIILNGWRSQNVFWKEAEYVSGDGALFTSWNQTQ